MITPTYAQYLQPTPLHLFIWTTGEHERADHLDADGMQVFYFGKGLTNYNTLEQKGVITATAVKNRYDGQGLSGRINERNTVQLYIIIASE